MKKIAKVKSLCSKPLRKRYLAATPAEREALRPAIEQEQASTCRRMARKGYRLEGTVTDVYGLFTRGQGQGAVRLDRHAEAVPA